MFFFFVGMEQPRVLILGHSFIRRLRDFIIRNSPTYNLNLNIKWQSLMGFSASKDRQRELFWYL